MSRFEANGKTRTPASGLYYLSEIVEEHTVIAKRVLVRLIQIVMALQLVICLVDRLPFSLTVLGIFSHLVYLGNMRRFPFVQLMDPNFLLSCCKIFLRLRMCPPSAGGRGESKEAVADGE